MFLRNPRVGMTELLRDNLQGDALHGQPAGVGVAQHVESDGRHDPASAIKGHGHNFMGRLALAIGRPRLHQLPTLLEQVAPAVRGFDLVTDGVRQRHFRHLTGEVRLLGGPVPEGGPEAVGGQIISLHALQQLQDRHIGQRLARSATGKNELALYDSSLRLDQP
jgi:hypothetical protein